MELLKQHSIDSLFLSYSVELNLFCFRLLLFVDEADAFLRKRSSVRFLSYFDVIIDISSLFGFVNYMRLLFRLLPNFGERLA